MNGARILIRGVAAFLDGAETTVTRTPDLKRPQD